jgi:hypothetical protein
MDKEVLCMYEGDPKLLEEAVTRIAATADMVGILADMVVAAALAETLPEDSAELLYVALESIATLRERSKA